MRDLRIASSCLAMRVIALGDAHGEEDCPRRHKYMFAAPEKVDFLVCLIVIHDVFKARVAFSARARYVWSKIRAWGELRQRAVAAVIGSASSISYL